MGGEGGHDVGGDGGVELEKHQGEFTRYGIDSAELQSLVLDLAYLQGLSRGQKGQGLSNQDVKNFAQIIGAKSSDPRIINNTLNSIITRFDESFRTNFETKVLKRPKSTLPDIDQMETLLTKLETAGREATAAELDALSPRAQRALLERLESAP